MLGLEPTSDFCDTAHPTAMSRDIRSVVVQPARNLKHGREPTELGGSACRGVRQAPQPYWHEASTSTEAHQSAKTLLGSDALSPKKAE